MYLNLTKSWNKSPKKSNIKARSTLCSINTVTEPQTTSTCSHGNESRLFTLKHSGPHTRRVQSKSSKQIYCFHECESENWSGCVRGQRTDTDSENRRKKSGHSWEWHGRTLAENQSKPVWEQHTDLHQTERNILQYIHMYYLLYFIILHSFLSIFFLKCIVSYLGKSFYFCF